jgi:peptidoglycan/LPS O-acetylase OafA/YrhL
VAPYLLFFAVGITSSVVKWKPSGALAGGSLVVAAASVILCIAGPWSGVLLGGTHRGPLYDVFNGPAEIIIAVPLIPWAIYTTRQEDTHSDSMLGDLSFIVYLLHWPVLHVIDTAAGAMVHRAAMIAEALGITISGSLLLWFVFDRPINNWRSRWVRSQFSRR